MFNRIEFEELTFDSLVIFEHDNVIFAHARQDSGPPRTFRIEGGGQGDVFTRNANQEWEQLDEDDAAGIRNRVREHQDTNIRIERVPCRCGCNTSYN